MLTFPAHDGPARPSVECMADARLAPRLRDRVGRLGSRPGWRRLLLLRRLAAAALAVLALVLAMAPPGGAGGVPVVVAVADVAAGSTLRAAELAVRRWPAELAPAGALREVSAAAGRVLVGAARAGEPLTDVRLAGAGAAAGSDGAAVPVRLADSGVAALLAPGSRVDVITAGERADQPVVLASDATVVAVLPEESGGRIVMIVMPRGTANRVAAASLSSEVTITLR